jgi:hypothetical protein
MPARAERTRRVVTVLAVLTSLAVTFAAASSFTTSLRVTPAHACTHRVLAGAAWLEHAGVDLLPRDTDCTDGTKAPRFSGARSVDLARRLYASKGWGRIPDVADLALKLPEKNVKPFEFHTNPGEYVPMPGDLVVFRPTRANDSGHVAVVDSIDQGKLQLVEQTAAAPAIYSIPISASGIGGNVEGVLHSPGNLGDPAGAATVVRTRSGAVLARQGRSAWHVIAQDAAEVATVRSRASGLVIAIRKNDGDVLVRRGIDGDWVRQRTKARSIALAADDVHGASLAVVTRGHRVLLDPGLTGRLLQEGDGVRSVALGSSTSLGPVLAVIDTADAPVVKKGLDGTWKKLKGRVRSLDVAVDRHDQVFVAAITVRDRVLLRSSRHPGWITVAKSASTAALDVSARGTPTVAVLQSDGRALVRTGLSGASTQRAVDVTALAFGTDSAGKRVLVTVLRDRIDLSTGHLDASDAPKGTREVTVQ